MTFFSGTDQSTLQSEGNDTNCFVSLIVNTEGTYSAAITRKVKTLKEVTVVDKGSSYEFFGEGGKPISNIGETQRENVENTVIEYFMLDVERHAVDNPLDYLDTRFEQIEAAKRKTEKAQLSLPFKPDSQFANRESSWADRWQNSMVEEPYLFDHETMRNLETSPNWQPDKKLIHTAICQMLACSLSVNAEKFDVDKWVYHSMSNVYERIFHDKRAFDEWKSFIVEFLIYHLEDFSAPSNIDDDTYMNTVAQALTDELEPYVDNKYVKAYYDELMSLIF